MIISTKSLSFSEEFRVKPGQKIRLKDMDPGIAVKHDDKKAAKRTIKKLQNQIEELQGQLNAEGKRSLLICLQGPDASGKDGTIRHVISAMNPQGCRVVSFKQPSSVELAHDFLWRIEQQTPGRGEVAIFNRSHYEDVLIVRVHNLVPKAVWSKRYEQINDFEQRLTANNTHILKFFLHISKEEQLERFKRRLDDPDRRWKISEADYSEREFWNDYEAAFESAITKCTTDEAPWYVVPSDNKWFRNLLISHAIVAMMQKMGIKRPQPSVDIDDIKKKYHEAIAEENAAALGDSHAKK